MSLAPAPEIQKGSVEGSMAPPPLNEQGAERNSANNEPATKKKRSLFGFGKKKTDDKATAADPIKTTSKPETSLPSPPLGRDLSQLSSAPSATTSPIPMDASHKAPSSPGRAITDDHLNPDSVEIVTHASHQPAAVTVTGAGPYDAQSSSWVDELQSLAEKDEAASNYGSLDSTDIRRLSFISFADVVQAEQGNNNVAASSRESMRIPGLTSLSSAAINRSPSPIRSPISSHAETSPPTSKSGSIKGLDMSPSRRPLGSPSSGAHTLGATTGTDLNIETMSQALRRTGSTDLSTARSPPISPIDGPSR
ncbi:uncharacterized protein PG998_013940 [Apiospora kogelbergensis]|uniref:uncharacterized protein n=1 Tax=Apiospora kogelbergensis TaxID=1337665 RepID=UPI00312D4223